MSDELAVSIPEFKTFQNEYPENGRKLYLNGDTGDVHFLFGASDVEDTVKRVPAHKALLSVCSDVFEKMFFGDLKETGDIHVTDSTDAEFVEFLQYFYLKEINLSAENIFGIFRLGHKYNVMKCIQHCIQFLTQKMDIEFVCECLHHALVYNQSELMKVCEKQILRNTAEILNSAAFSKCHKDVLGHILKMDTLPCPEVEIFQACMRWVEANIGDDETLSKESVERHLGNLYYTIRFASMTMEQLLTLQTQYESVVTPDFITISKVIVNSESDFFNTSPRHAKWKENAIIECSFKDGNKLRVRLPSKMHSSEFSTNELLLLGGFRCSGLAAIENGSQRYLYAELPVDVEIIEVCDSTKSRSILKMKASLQSTDTNVTLPHPILARPGYRYIILIQSIPNDVGIISEGLKTEIQIQSNITIQMHEFLVKNTGEKVGLIWALDFNEI